MDIDQYKLSCSYLPAFIILLPRRNGFTRNFYSSFFRVFCVSVAKSYFLYCLLFRAFCVSAAKSCFLYCHGETDFHGIFIPFFFRVFCVSVANLYSFSCHREPDLHRTLFPSFSVPSVFPWLNPIFFIATEKRNYTKFSPFFFRVFCVSVAKSYFLYCHGETDLHGTFIPFFFRAFCVSVANSYFFIATEKRIYTEFLSFFFRAFCVSAAKSYFLYCHREPDLHGSFNFLFPCLLCFRGKLLLLPRNLLNQPVH